MDDDFDLENLFADSTSARESQLEIEVEHLTMQNADLKEMNSKLENKITNLMIYFEKAAKQMKFLEQKIAKLGEQNSKKKEKTAQTSTIFWNRTRNKSINILLNQLLCSSSEKVKIKAIGDIKEEETTLTEEFYKDAKDNIKSAEGVPLRRYFIAGIYAEQIVSFYDQYVNPKIKLQKRKLKKDKNSAAMYFTPEEIQNKNFVESKGKGYTGRNNLMRYVNLKNEIDKINDEEVRNKALNSIVPMSNCLSLMAYIPTHSKKKVPEKLFGVVCEFYRMHMHKNKPSDCNYSNFMKLIRIQRKKALRLQLLPADFTKMF